MCVQLNLYKVPSDSFEWEVEEEDNDAAANLDDDDSDD